ncbi:hypothetical protein QQF64_001558 [Cirrhinus molitorella]|uniref:Uncharacterized protein n=1 Tax=Cirrhinus molitorella TaxID=172907 RepID=A0ABR3P0T8_9TELE
MTTGEDTEPSLWPDRAQASLTAPVQADGPCLEEAEDLPGGLTGSGGASWESTGSVAEVKENAQLPYPSLAPVVFFWLHQSTRPRSWCLALVCSPYPFYMYALAYFHFSVVYWLDKNCVCSISTCNEQNFM